MIAAVVSGAALPSDRHSAEAGQFVGDFEVGPPGWQQYSGLQYEEDRPLEESFQLVDDPVRQGRSAARYTVRQGYSRFGYNEDVSAVWKSNEREGDEFWYAWSTLFPKTWSAPEGWGIFAEWHANLGTSPIISFSARSDTAVLNLHAGLTNEAANTYVVDRTIPLLETLSKGRWNDFVLHVRWTASATGLVEAYHRVAGEAGLRRIVSVRETPTFQVTRDGRGLGTYLLFGLYRRSYCAQPTQLGCTSPRGRQPDSVLYQDGFTRAATYEEAARVAFPGPVPKLVIPEPPRARAAEPLVLRSRARVVGRHVDAGCISCSVSFEGASLTARIGGGRDDRDTALAVFAPIARRGTLVARSRVSVAGVKPGGNLVLISVLDERGKTIAEVFRSHPDGKLALWSPAGALRRDPIRVETSAGLPPGVRRDVELRLAPQSIALVVGGRVQAQVSALPPRAQGALRVRAGIDHYDAATVRAPIVARLERLVVGSTSR